MRPLYHVEVQTEYDRMMDNRMVRYGYLIGTARSEINNDDIRVITIPHQVVIYLEENSRISDEMTVRIVLPTGSELDYTVPVLNYSSIQCKNWVRQTSIFSCLWFW